jgi:hypothetical protein
MNNLWTKDVEKKFFLESLDFATIEQLFYVTESNKYLAYWPKGYAGKKSTFQSRNSLIGSFTEKWTTDLIQKIVSNKGLYAVSGAICNEIALTNLSPADVVISKKKEINQISEDILAIIEVKMSIVWNWEYFNGGLICIGDYATHQGYPGLLRSDSMLKAIGKAINIRVSSEKASNIPIIIMGNTPITKSYYPKVDHLKKSGIIQGFCSINPAPLDNNNDNIKSTTSSGFLRMDGLDELSGYIDDLLSSKLNFFSSMKTKSELGRIIRLANQEKTDESRAEAFLKMLKGDKFD